ncbi:hypothetical protein BGW41_005375 [Actinomortierella wolfii]|nr:hypothetical protein BGW41_005375 [Actinomortierella wolfii]
MTTVQEDPKRCFAPHSGHEAQTQLVSQQPSLAPSTFHQPTTTLCPPSPVGGTAVAPALLLHSRYNSARSISHRSSVASTARRSISTVHSHVSDFQNVRFDPDPAKDISLWGGIALLISNMTGPGLVTVPIIAQQAGWLPTIAVFALIGLLSSLSSLFICEAMTEVPGNEYFQSNVEFSNLVLCFFGKRYHVLVQVIFFLAMQTTNIASIAVSAQLFDNLLIKLFHQTCGIRIAPHPGFVCVNEQLNSASPFSGVMIMSAGVLVALAMILPLAFLKLSENIWIQLASFILVLFVVLQWIVTFFIHGLDSTLVPLVGSDVSQIFGTVLFNYAFITTVPSWANAKQPNVSIHKTIGYSVSITTVIYILVAILGGMAFHIPEDSTLIQAINSSPQVSVLSQITGYTFPIAALITSIPINIIVIRYNLIQSGVCNMFWSNMLSAVAPWLVAVPCMTGTGLTTVINWSSLFLLSTANFLIPFILYIYSKKHKDKLRKLPIIELEQHVRLSREVSYSSHSGFSRRPSSMVESLRQRHNQSYPDLHIMSSTTATGGNTAPPSPGGRSIGHHSAGHSSEDHSQRHHPTSSHSESNLWSAGHRRLGTNQTGHSPWPSLETPTMSGPYFSFAKDGELHERDASGASSSHPPTSGAIRPSGSSTVILHDPVTEMAQRKATLQRRLSRKDRILSLISEKHKRALEQQQEKERMQGQNEKPVPPMILLSQSTTDLTIEGINEKDTDLEEQQHIPTNYEDAPTIPEEGTPTDASSDGRRIHRKSSFFSSALNKLHKSFVPSSPTTQRSYDMTFGNYHKASFEEVLQGRDSQSHKTEHPSKESPASPTLSISASFSPISPKKSALKKSSVHSPGAATPTVQDHDMSTPRPSLSIPTLAAGTDQNRRDSGSMINAATMDNSRLSPSGPAGSQSHSPQLAAAIVTMPSTPDSASASPLSPRSPDRRVSFSDEQAQPNASSTTTTAMSPPQSLPPPQATHLERKPSFSSETKRAMRAALQGLTGGSPKPFSSSSPSTSTSIAREGSQKLLRREDSNSRDSTASTSSSNSLDDEHDLGPELDVAKAGESGLRTPTFGHYSADIANVTTAAGGGWMITQPQAVVAPKGIAAAVASQGRRDSIGRMAAAFSSQPGSFAIKTTRSDSGQQQLQLPRRTGEGQDVSRSSTLVPEDRKDVRDTKPLSTVMTLSPSSPPLLPIPPAADMNPAGEFTLPTTLRMDQTERECEEQQHQSRQHVNAEEVTEQSSTTSGTDKQTLSTQSLKDMNRFPPSSSHPTLLAVSTVMTPTMHLTPPSPLLNQDVPQFGPLSLPSSRPSSPSSPSFTITTSQPTVIESQPTFDPPSPCTPPPGGTYSHSHSHSQSLSASPWTGMGFGGCGKDEKSAHRRQSSHQLPNSHFCRTNRSSPSPASHRIITPPFLGGNNYSIPGFSSSSHQSGHDKSPTLDHFPILGGAGVGLSGGEPLEDGSNNHGRKRHGYHTREHSRSTMISALGGRLSPSSPPPLIVPGHDTMLPDGGVTSSTAAAITTTTMVSSAVAGLGGGGFDGRGGGGSNGLCGRPSLPESQWTLPQHQQSLADFDAQWSLRAIPEWVPLSSLTVAWSSLGVLCFGIGATIIYDFVLLGLGKNPVGSS